MTDYLNIKGLNLAGIKQIRFPDDEYCREKQTKRQVILHHTVSGDNPTSIADDWATRKGKTCTPFIIARDGAIYQLFSSMFWSIHLFFDNKPFERFKIRKSKRAEIEKQSIGIEMISWGGLVEGHKDNQFITTYGNVLNYKTEADMLKDISYYPDGYRGYNYFQKYTEAQLVSAYQLCHYLMKRYGITHTFDSEMFDISKKALEQTPGVWVHSSFRDDKSDCPPQPELIEMLKAL